MRRIEMKPTRGLALAMVFGISPGVLSDVPPRSDSGTTLRVPDAHAALGKLFFIRYPSDSTQVTFRSDAPIEIIVGTTSKVVGYMVLEEEDGQATGRILAGAFRLPVRSLDSGIPLRNQHMQQENFFHADAHPDITFEITGSDDVHVTEDHEKYTTYVLVLRGEMTIRGVTKTLAIPARFTLMPASDLTRNAGPGDVLALRCRYTVHRSEFELGWKGDNPELADEITIDQAIISTSNSPESRLAAAPNGDVQIALRWFQVLIGDLQEPAQAYDHARGLIEKIWEDADSLNTLAWTIATFPAGLRRDYELATLAATRANDLNDGSSADVLDTMARIHYEQGHLEDAIEWQRKAAIHKENSADPDGIAQTLAKYETEAGLEVSDLARVEEIKDLPLGTDEAATYLGRFTLEELGQTFAVELGDDGIYFRMGDQPATRLLSQGEHQFRLEADTGIRVEFTVEGDRAVEVTIQSRRRTFSARRAD